MFFHSRKKSFYLTDSTFVCELLNSIESDGASSTIIAAATPSTVEKKSLNSANIESDKSKIPNSTPSSSSIVPVNPIKYQYYQSADALNISILVKGITEEEVSV